MISREITAYAPHILVIEDDPRIRRLLKLNLDTEAYRVYEAETAAEGLQQAAARQPEVILLDLALPDFDGIEVIRKIREWNKNVPIIVLSVRDMESAKIDSLDAGADDYITKPFAVGELLARVRAALRRSIPRSEGDAGSVFRIGGIEVDFMRRRVLLDGLEIHLTRIEYKLLQTLIRHAGRVITHKQLLHEVWGPDHTDQSHYLRVYMAQLRRKLEADPAKPRYLRTEPGIGYRLTAG